MKRIVDYFYRIVDIAMIVMFVVMTFAISINVICRYFGMALTWADEISGLSFVWMSFLAITVGQRLGLHPTFMLLLEKANKKQARFMYLCINLLVLIFLVYLLVGGYSFVSRIAYQRTPILGISVAWKYSAVIFSSFIMIINTISEFISIWKRGVTKSEGEAA